MFYWHLILDRSTAFVDTVSKIHPDVGVVDISMPVMNGSGATAEINSRGSAMKMILLTVNKDPDFVRAAFEAGASGYGKNCCPADRVRYEIRSPLLQQLCNN